MVKSYSIFAAVLAVTASAYNEFKMSVDDTVLTKFYRS